MACGGWSSVPADLLQEISRRLSSDADHLHIHQVCTHWRASTSPLAACRPWVVAGCARPRGLLPIGDYSLRLPLGGAQRMEVGAPPAGLFYCCGASSRGWLALLDGALSPTRIVLWEPLSNIETPLPCLNPVSQIFISDDPLASSNWIAIAAHPKGILGQRTLFWRPGDAAWSMMYDQDQDTTEINSITFHGGKAHYIDIMHNIIICALNIGTDSPPECTRIDHVWSAVNNLCSCDMPHPVRGVHLVALQRRAVAFGVALGKPPLAG
ncbi:hypothetical protein BAE44_0017457 [Dichanthelium oligosanthes]|uniref:KIB1-4 beta-propeller domain-containing protein n=1 Tax=Dichanthelium oligosanthes TaxID=888268 RepID=A0A1E5V8Z6_9POAL|nr:hypothetical protein BAE44_0017457 [Dichanthelium oligosanthes]